MKIPNFEQSSKPSWRGFEQSSKPSWRGFEQSSKPSWRGIENAGFIGAIIIGILAFFYLILGISGAISALGILLFFTLPFYLILSNSQLEQDEKIVFSFFIGVGIFPSITYWLGMFISLRLSILVAFVVLVIAGYLVWKFGKKF